MSGKHWSDDELLDRLYGVGPDDDHLSFCAECEGRLQELAARRSAVVLNGESAVDAGVDAALLLRQRAAVMDRIEKSAGSFISWRAVTAFAGATAMILGFAIYQPQRTKPAFQQPATQSVARTASSDTQFFSEIYSAVEQTEPRAVKPMRRLFEERP